MRLINIITLCALAVLACKTGSLEKKTDKLTVDTGDAFAAVTHHLEKMAVHNKTKSGGKNCGN
jgi:hypothetical protein